jgi:molecular chaperone GrpE
MSTKGLLFETMTTTPPTFDDTQPEGSTAGEAAAAGTAAPELTPEEQISALQAKLAETNDAYLRARAEVENTRRRSEEEMSKARKFAVDGFAESLLPVRDSLEAAAALKNATEEQMREGVEATLRQLIQAMERSKLLQIKPETGTKFDPHQHQAISMVPCEQDANTIVSVLQPGYLIAERVLRPALVTVAAPK